MGGSNEVSTKSHAPSSAPRVRAVLLAAGGSRRMGAPKALLTLGGRTVLARHLDALGAVADPVVVVLGGAALDVGRALPDGVSRVFNPRWAETTPIDSLVMGIRAAPGDGWVLVSPVDVVPARAETLRALLAAGRAAVPVGADGRRGHPVLLDPATARAVCDAPPADGLRGALADAAEVPVADPWVAEDFDDPAAFAAIAAATADRWR